ncbi:SNF2-related protein [Clostridium sp. HCP1S3_B4]|uniref:SNF2-related protein n=1 Tax=unclassified Clostridium TaxID=2614128 RepID=UPI003F8A2BF6
MSSEWKIICPKHNTELTAEKTIPISSEGIVTRHPLFYCNDCGCYYFHADKSLQNSTFEYGKYQVLYTNNEPYQAAEEIIITDLLAVKFYDEPFVPITCYKEDSELEFVSKVVIEVDREQYIVEGYYCQNCGDVYINVENNELLHNIIENRISSQDKEKKEYSNSEYVFSKMLPSTRRKTTKDVLCYLGKYEDCERAYSNDFPYSLFHYAFLFRRFDVVAKIINSMSYEELKIALHFSGEKGYEWITPLVCAKWNLNYLYAYDEKNNTNIMDSIEEYLHEVDHVDEVIEYTDVISPDGKNVFDVFWDNIQPMLDVIYFDRQELASRQVFNNQISIVMDEVGTGKTVSALYAIKETINSCRQMNRMAKILIVCPYNKREDWQNDIRRQLGRFAHIIEQGDNGLMYAGHLKKVFFKSSEDIIMIAGQKQGSDLEGSYTALKGTIMDYAEDEKWDIVIIDEGHISFQNYRGIVAKKAMILTATPIVINSKERRTFEDYVQLLQEITCSHIVTRDIEPIHNYLPNDKDIYVNWFREDMGKNAAERRIRFVSCKRHPDRDEIYYRIKDEVGVLVALQYDQDDNFLFDAAENRYGFSNIKEIRKNGKIEKLVKVLKESNKSYIIFCEHQFVVDLIFKRLKNEFAGCIVAEKYGKFENQNGLGNVQDGQLINTLMQALRNNQRVLLITTGKTGGTGLNLGEFDGVIHYELPFTSIELEQRFGRVDRIDTGIAGKNRDMIFMLNECKPDENDMENNRMLYYCTTKIDITCQYMPIRNTVLYYPEFVKRNGRAIREALVYFQNEYVLSEANEKKIRGIRKQRHKYESEIRKSEYWDIISSLGRTVRECVLNVLRIEKMDSIDNEQYEYMGEYIEFLKMTKSERNEYERVYRKFLDAKKNANYWLAIIGLIEIDANSEIFVGYGSVEDGDEQKIKVDEEKDDAESMKKITSVQRQIKKLIQMVDDSDFENAELKSFSSEGIFCYVDNVIKRSTVAEYRNGNGWN